MGDDKYGAVSEGAYESKFLLVHVDKSSDGHHGEYWAKECILRNKSQQRADMIYMPLCLYTMMPSYAFICGVTVQHVCSNIDLSVKVFVALCVNVRDSSLLEKETMTVIYSSSVYIQCQRATVSLTRQQEYDVCKLNAIFKYNNFYLTQLISNGRPFMQTHGGAPYVCCTVVYPFFIREHMRQYNRIYKDANLYTLQATDPIPYDDSAGRATQSIYGTPVSGQHTKQRLCDNATQGNNMPAGRVYTRGVLNDAVDVPELTTYLSYVYYKLICTLTNSKIHNDEKEITDTLYCFWLPESENDTLPLMRHLSDMYVTKCWQYNHSKVSYHVTLTYGFTNDMYISIVEKRIKYFQYTKCNLCSVRSLDKKSTSQCHNSAFSKALIHLRDTPLLTRHTAAYGDTKIFRTLLSTRVIYCILPSSFWVRHLTGSKETKLTRLTVTSTVDDFSCGNLCACKNKVYNEYSLHLRVYRGYQGQVYIHFFVHIFQFLPTYLSKPITTGADRWTYQATLSLQHTMQQLNMPCTCGGANHAGGRDYDGGRIEIWWSWLTICDISYVMFYFYYECTNNLSQYLWQYVYNRRTTLVMPSVSYDGSYLETLLMGVLCVVRILQNYKYGLQWSDSHMFMVYNLQFEVEYTPNQRQAYSLTCVLFAWILYDVYNNVCISIVSSLPYTDADLNIYTFRVPPETPYNTSDVELMMGRARRTRPLVPAYADAIADKHTSLKRTISPLQTSKRHSSRWCLETSYDYATQTMDERNSVGMCPEGEGHESTHNEIFSATFIVFIYITLYRYSLRGDICKPCMCLWYSVNSMDKPPQSRWIIQI